MSEQKKFVGFGFGPIQSGLMLYEAYKSRNFDSFVIAEVDQKLVDAVRGNNNSVTINIALETGIVSDTITGITILNPSVPADRVLLAAAIHNADEMATAIPNVHLYGAGGEGSIVELLCANVNPQKQQILYASENNNYAAEILRDELREHMGDANRFGQFQILNTVIGKMSGIIKDEPTMQRLGLKPFVPGQVRAILVEEFNRILVSKVTLPGFVRAIPAFEEKPDLLPFEEAKLFGHNAIHSLLGYLGFTRGYTSMSQIRGDKELMTLGLTAFTAESGAALTRKYGHLRDPLFTPEGFSAYADELLQRMTNPFLHDEVERICRDPGRKLGFSDRIFGTMREAISAGVSPRTMALGAYAGVLYYFKEREGAIPATMNAPMVKTLLESLWSQEVSPALKDECIALTVEAGSSAVFSPEVRII